MFGCGFYSKRVMETHMIRAHKAGLFPIAGCKKRGMMATNIVESMKIPISVSTDHKLYTSQSVVFFFKLVTLIRKNIHFKRADFSLKIK